MSDTGVLVVGFGGPDSLDAVAPFMCNLMGREPSEELVQSVCRRYLAIGGSSPLTEIARGFADKLADALASLGTAVPVEIGMAYWHPFIEEAVGRLKAQGCSRLVVVSLSPFESKVASSAYRDAIARAAAELGGLEVVEAPLLSSLPEYVSYMAGGIATALSDIDPNEGIIIAMTAHSLPVSDLTADDPYVAGLRETASRVAEMLGLHEPEVNAGEGVFEEFRAFGSARKPRGWYLVFQSKGNRPGEWLGPDLDDLIDVCIDSPIRGIVVSPIGFATDHMETLYDLDIVSADKALLGDLTFVRAPVPNDADVIVEAVARSVAELV